MWCSQRGHKVYIQYGASAFRAGYLRLQTHTQNVRYLFLFHYSNGCTNAPQYYVMHTMPASSRISFTYTTLSKRSFYFRYFHQKNRARVFVCHREPGNIDAITTTSAICCYFITVTVVWPEGLVFLFDSYRFATVGSSTYVNRCS